MNKQAQSTLELIAVITFVTVAILVVGPTVIRGINAHFKLWDDTIQDSYNDPMNKASKPTTSPTCTCSGWQGSAPSQCDASFCGPKQRYEYKSCDPPNCQTPSEQCVDDPACCEQYRDTLLCGSGGFPRCTGETTEPPICDCAIDHRKIVKGCGNNTDRYGCRPDSSGTDGNISCVPQCLGQYATVPVTNPADPAYNPTVGVICPGPPRDDTGLTPPFVYGPTGFGINVDYVGTGTSSCNQNTPDAQCEVYCLPGYQPNATKTACQRNCLTTKTFTFGPIGEINHHYRVLGQWDRCDVTKCNISSADNPGYCILYQQGPTTIRLRHVAPIDQNCEEGEDDACLACCEDNDRKACYGGEPPFSAGFTYADENCIDKTVSCDKICRLQPTTVNPGDWYLLIRLGEGDRVKEAGDVTVTCSKCTEQPPVMEGWVILYSYNPYDSPTTTYCSCPTPTEPYCSVLSGGVSADRLCSMFNPGNFSLSSTISNGTLTVAGSYTGPTLEGICWLTRNQGYATYSESLLQVKLQDGVPFSLSTSMASDTYYFTCQMAPLGRLGFISYKIQKN